MVHARRFWAMYTGATKNGRGGPVDLRKQASVVVIQQVMSAIANADSMTFKYRKWQCQRDGVVLFERVRSHLLGHCCLDPQRLRILS